MAIHLFSQYYVPKDTVREQEVDECVRRNIANPEIDVYHVLLEREEDRSRIPRSPKVRIQHLPTRITYCDWLRFSNDLNQGDVSVLINADIYLNQTIGELRQYAKQMAQENGFLALTRYNFNGDRLLLNGNPHWAQDTWVVVRGEKKFNRTLLQETSFELGHPGCDNKIAYVMHSHGFTVSNPCLSIQTVHLHKEEGRPYDSRADKLLGLHAFVHPVAELGQESRLDVDLLSRATRDLTNVNVNHWINHRKSYPLAGSSKNEEFVREQPALVDPVVLASASFVETIVAPAVVNNDSATLNKKHEQSATLSTNRRGVIEYLRKDSVDLSSLRPVVTFSSRLQVLEDEAHLYYCDAVWPAINRVCKSDLGADFASLKPLDQFCIGFLPPVLDVFPSTISPTPKHPRDLLFWQYPCRTEQDAWEKSCAVTVTHDEPGVKHIYIGLPWATFIDREKDAGVLIALISARISHLRGLLSNFKTQLRVHTVCQHIFWQRQLANFKRIGVTDLWISHKQLGVEGIEGVRLHPWHLYAVNFLDVQRQSGIDIKLADQREKLACFSGAHMEHYISDVRQRLSALSAHRGFDINLTGEWHFNRVVYEHQIHGRDAPLQAINADSVEAYNRDLSNSVFSLCPVGAGPNTLRFWESLAMGSIPVLLSDTADLPDLARLFPSQMLTWEDCIVRVAESDVADIPQRLAMIDTQRRLTMQANCRLAFELMHGFSPLGYISPRFDQALDLLCRFKSQQIHLQGNTHAVVDGVCRWGGAELALAASETDWLIHFDQTEKLAGFQVEFLETAGQQVELCIGRSIRFNRNTLVTTLKSAHARVQTFWVADDETDPWAIAATVKAIVKSEQVVKPARVRLSFFVEKNSFARQISQIDDIGLLAAVSDDSPVRQDDLFDTEHIESGNIINKLRGAASDLNSRKPVSLFKPVQRPTHNLLDEPIGAGVSMFVHLMNRNENVVKNLSNWLGQKFDELILLDWSSTDPVHAIPDIFKDPRVRVVRVEGQKTFVRSWAQNLASRVARYHKIFKCDSDVEFHGDFFAAHSLEPGEFWVGDWMQGRDYNERHLHGETFYCIEDFLRVNGYDERIGSYGHDDTNLKDRMVLAGLRKKVFSYNMLHHQEHDNSKRTTNQQMLHPMINTRYHRIMTNEMPLWSQRLGTTFKPTLVSNEGNLVVMRVDDEIVNQSSESALNKAVDLVASWYVPVKDLGKLSRDEKVAVVWEHSLE